jgi:septal ring factor EnvC (AmiA/AmiB activator)
MTDSTTSAQIDRALRSITHNVRSLDRALAEVERDVKNARAAIAAGNAVSGSAMGYGPIGHQAPFEVAALTASVRTGIDTAMMLGATSEQIAEAYTSKAGF